MYALREWQFNGNSLVAHPSETRCKVIACNLHTKDVKIGE